MIIHLLSLNVLTVHTNTNVVNAMLINKTVGNVENRVISVNPSSAPSGSHVTSEFVETDTLTDNSDYTDEDSDISPNVHPINSELFRCSTY